MRYFNTSGPNIPARHYTIVREALLERGISLISEERYFTIWAPRQTGKSTYFKQLAEKLTVLGYEVAYINFESYKNASVSSFAQTLTGELKRFWGETFETEDLQKIFYQIECINDRKLVLIIDEVEGINPEYFGEVLHSFRRLYHSRETNSLKSIVLVGVTNILGVVQDNASPFNIADNLEVPYFTKEESHALLKQHETETGQQFEDKVIDKIFEITAGQPGLVNGFANKLVEQNPQKNLLTYTDYLKVEHWYVDVAIDKNFSNILNKAKQYRVFVEGLLFTEREVKFDIDREEIKFLHTNGLVKEDKYNNIEFWVPFYKKRLYKAFYPYTNGEGSRIGSLIDKSKFLTPDGLLDIHKVINDFRAYVKRRGFGVFREKDEQGKFTSIPEAAFIYSFETYIQAFVQELEGKTYREANTGLGKSDLILTIGKSEMLIETKIFYGSNKFEKGKKQTAYYCKSLGLATGVYIVFVAEEIRQIRNLEDSKEMIDGVEILTYIVPYDEEKGF